MLLNNRHGSVDSDAYRFGFQGQERDDEVKGEGNSFNYKYRMHDPRIGRFFAVDPLSPKYPMLTPYQFASNSPIAKSEIEGLEGGWVIENGKVKYAKGPVLNAFSSAEAAKNALESRIAVIGNEIPSLPRSAQYKPEHSITQQTETRKVLSKRKEKYELALKQQELMKWTYSIPGMQVAHGVYVGLPEGLMEVSGLMVIDKAIDAYRVFKFTRGLKYTDDVFLNYTPIVNNSRTYQVGGISRTIQRNSAREVTGGSFARLSDNGYTLTFYKESNWLRKADRVFKTTVESRPIDDIIYGSIQIRSVTGLTTPVQGLTTSQTVGAIGLGSAAAYGTYRGVLNSRQNQQSQNEDLIKQIIQNPNGDNP